MSSLTTNLAPPERALAVGAHADDVEFGCGATLAKWARAGTHVDLLVCTDGSKGTWDADDDLAALVARREDEQRAAAAELGLASTTFLRLVDGELVNGRAEQARVCEVVRRCRPDVVLGHDPWKRYRLHPDHRRAGFLLLDALVAARDPHFFPEQALAPHRPSTVLLFEADVEDHAEDVHAFVEVKIAALLRHRSQWRSTMGITDDPEAQTARFARSQLDAARRAGAPFGLELAEAFKRIDEL